MWYISESIIIYYYCFQSFVSSISDSAPEPKRKNKGQTKVQNSPQAGSIQDNLYNTKPVAQPMASNKAISNFQIPVFTNVPTMPPSMTMTPAMTMTTTAAQPQVINRFMYNTDILFM
jgi:hypothetical protein